MRDDLTLDSLLSIAEKMIKIMQYIFQKEHHPELVKYYWRQVRYRSKNLLFFLAERKRSF